MNTGTKHVELARLENVTKAFGSGSARRETLRKVSLAVHTGELILLLGPSGSGKTTLLTILAALQSPTSGTAYLFGKPVQDYSPSALQRVRARNIGFIFQTFYLIESLTAIENVLLALKFAGVTGKEARNRAADFLDKFGVGHLAHHDTTSFSQGEKQRVAVSRALATHAPLIIADEPTGSLDSTQGMLIASMLKDRVRKDDLCVIIASHDERIAQFADRILYLNDGELVERSPIASASGQT